MGRWRRKYANFCPMIEIGGIWKRARVKVEVEVEIFAQLPRDNV